MSIPKYQKTLDASENLRLQIISEIKEIVSNSGVECLAIQQCDLVMVDNSDEFRVVCVTNEFVYYNFYYNEGTSGERIRLNDITIIFAENILRVLSNSVEKNTLQEWVPITFRELYLLNVNFPRGESDFPYLEYGAFFGEVSAEFFAKKAKELEMKYKAQPLMNNFLSGQELPPNEVKELNWEEFKGLLYTNYSIDKIMERELLLQWLYRPVPYTTVSGAGKVKALLN